LIVFIGEKLAWIVETIVKHPWESLGVIIAGKLAIWYARGMSLGAGFNMTTKGFMGGTRGALANKGNQVGGIRGAMMKSAGGKYGIGTARGMGAGLGMGVAGMGLDYGRGQMDDPNSAGGKALGVGSSMLKGAGMGMMLGPWGAAIGAVLGGIYGAYNEYSDESKGIGGAQMQDFISRPGENPVSFSEKDTLVGAKKGGPIDKMLDGGGGTKPSTGKVLIEFNKPLMIEGNIDLTSGNQSASIDLNDPIFMREISRVVQEHISKAVGGGKLSSNPVILT